MESKFELDKAGIKKLVNESVRKAMPEHQRVFDSVYRTHNGQPVDDVKLALRQQWRSRLGTEADITDQELTEWATLISAGTKLQLDGSGLRYGPTHSR